MTRRDRKGNGNFCRLSTPTIGARSPLGEGDCLALPASEDGHQLAGAYSGSSAWVSESSVDGVPWPL